MLKMQYVFKNKEIFSQALTHRSAGNNNNERLEFLGDSILNFVIASALFRQFPRATEGELSRLRASLVKRETLSQLAREINLGGYLILGQGESKTGGAARASILADAVEALIGAVYLDSDMLVCETLILSWYADFLSKLTLDSTHKDPKTELQEYLQRLHKPLPVYKLMAMTGDEHDPWFVVQCTSHLTPQEITGEGNSRKRAEQEAAKNMLQVLLSEK